MFHNSPAQFYVTFFFGDLETGSGRMRYVNAGHIPPILYRAKSRSIERLAAGGTVLGLFAETPFEAGEVVFEPGDILLVFTDGLSEAWGQDEQEFGEDRMGALVRSNSSLSAKELERTIQNEVETFTGGARATDDRTLIVVKRT
jgi:sigma-B regulation protein RsbU (phosphoserine phosphatase)